MKTATYIKGSTNVSEAPSDLPIFLLVGRSNVGKSSFINALTKRKSLARTSGTPGKTIALNYYLINDNFYIVDAPGYGYARRSKVLQEQFILMLDNILTSHPKLMSVLVLIDFKVGPTKDDLEIIEYINALGLEHVIVATKMDKINKTKRYKHEQMILKKLGYPTNFISVSSSKKIKIDDVRAGMLERAQKYE